MKSSKKKGFISELETGEEVSEHGEEQWLVSYADMMTLLFGFFAMMFTFATFDSDGYVRIKKELARYFGGAYAQGAGQAEGLLSEKVRENLEKNGLYSDAQLKVRKNGIDVSFITNVLFKTGGAELTTEATEKVTLLISIIKDATPRGSRPPDILVEGHSDDIPLNGGPYGSNWGLSAARASTIVGMFEKAGFPAETLSAIGYGSSRPAFANRTPAGTPIPENQALNRRVVIKVTHDDEAGE